MSSNVKIDFHTHSLFSHDAFTTMRQLGKFFRKNPDFVLAVTDHNEIEGALEARELFGDHIIIGEEIKTNQGEIIGLFLKKFVQPGMSILETVKEIREQDGLVMVPHPFKRHGNVDSPILEDQLYMLHEHFDMIEVFNARNRTPGANVKACDFAEKYNKPQTVGSDAHAVYEIGSTYIDLPVYNGRSTLIENLRQGRKVCGSIPFHHRLFTRFQREIRKLL